MNIAILEDQPEDALWLKKHIEEFLQSARIYGNIHCFSNGADLMEHFALKKYTMVFIDIYLGEESGMTIAQEIRKTDQECLLIFVTSSDSHAIESYQVRAFYYLKKPLDGEDFFHVLNLCQKTLKAKASYIEIKEGRIIARILLGSILYADTDKHYIQLHCTNGIRRSRMIFEELRTLLLKDSRFLSCYRNTMVNMDYIDYIDKQTIVLTNGEQVLIQRNWYTQIKQCYCDYCFEKMKGNFL